VIQRPIKTPGCKRCQAQLASAVQVMERPDAAPAAVSHLPGPIRELSSTIKISSIHARANNASSSPGGSRLRCKWYHDDCFGHPDLRIIYTMFPAIFLDRDGSSSKMWLRMYELGRRVDLSAGCPGAGTPVSQPYKFVIVTNQAGISKGCSPRLRLMLSTSA